MQRVSNRRALDAIRRIDIDRRVYRGSDEVIDMQLADGLVEPRDVPCCWRVALAAAGRAVSQLLAASDQNGAARMLAR